MIVGHDALSACRIRVALDVEEIEQDDVWPCLAGDANGTVDSPEPRRRSRCQRHPLARRGSTPGRLTSHHSAGRGPCKTQSTPRPGRVLLKTSIRRCRKRRGGGRGVVGFLQWPWCLSPVSRCASAPSICATWLSAHSDALADAVLERFAAGAGPDGAPDAATLRNLRLGARGAVDCFLARLAGERRVADDALFVAHGRAQQAAGPDAHRVSCPVLPAWRAGDGGALDRPAAASGVAACAAEIFAFGSAVLELVDVSCRSRGLAVSPPRRPRRAGAAARSVKRAVALLLNEPPVAGDAIVGRDRGGLATPGPGARRRRRRCRPTRWPCPTGPPPERVLTAPVADGRLALVVADGEEAERWLTSYRDRAAARGAAGDRPDRPGQPPPPAAPRAPSHSLDHVTAGGAGRPRGAGACALRRPRDRAAARCRARARPRGRRSVASHHCATLEPAARARLTATLRRLARRSGPPAGDGRPPWPPRADLSATGSKALRGLFGDALDDPDERFELSLALRVGEG